MKKFMLYIIILSLVFSADIVYAAPSSGITINLPSRTLEYNKGSVHKEYPVAIGKSLSSTPDGSYRVRAKVKNPTWHPPGGGKPVLPGKNNPLGRRWINFYPTYGIHGNNKPKSIGTMASLGCVRMYNSDVNELFDMVSVGTPVNITYQTASKIYDDDRVTLKLYPDVYGWGVNSQAKVRAKLSRMGISIGEEKFKHIFTNNKKTTCFYTGGWILTKGDKYLSADLVRENNVMYISSNSVKKVFGIDYKTDMQTGKMSVNGHTLGCMEQNGRTYIDLNRLLDLFHVVYKTDTSAKRVDITSNMIFANGKLIGKTDYADYDKRDIKLPLKEMGEQMGFKVVWNPSSKELSINNKYVPALIINGSSYMDIEKLSHIIKFNYKIDSLYDIIHIKR